MVKSLFIIAVVLCTALATVAEPHVSQTRQYSARAFDLKSGALLYTEHHSDSLHHGQISTSSVIYVDSAGDTLASKRLQFDAGATRPAFVMEYGDGYAEGVKAAGDSLELLRRSSATAEAETRTVAINEPVVIDGGFDYAVRQHWDRLAEGGRFDFDFPVPNRLASYRFRIRMTGETIHDGSPARRFRIEPANFFVRLIAPSIELTYDHKSRRLMQYEGISNVADPATGRRYRARIEFVYADGEDGEPLVLDATARVESF